MFILLISGQKQRKVSQENILLKVNVLKINETPILNDGKFSYREVALCIFVWGRSVCGCESVLVFQCFVNNAKECHVFSDTGLKGSLERLQLDYVDLVFANKPDPHTPMEGLLAL